MNLVRSPRCAVTYTWYTSTVNKKEVRRCSDDMLWSMIEVGTGSSLLRVDATTQLTNNKWKIKIKKHERLHLATSGLSGYQKSETAGGWTVHSQPVDTPLYIKRTPKSTYVSIALYRLIFTAHLTRIQHLRRQAYYTSTTGNSNMAHQQPLPSADSLDFKDLVVLVTGAGSGIGKT